MINGDHYYILNLDTEDETIPKQDTQFATPMKRKKDKYQVYCNNVRREIDDQETEFWEKKIKKYLKPLEQDKNKEKAATEALIELRNSVCIFVFLLNAMLVTVIFSLTQINAFKDTLSVKFTCGGNDVNIVPISIMFAAVFGLLLFIQFICMLYHRISTLIHITAETKIREDKRDKIMNEELRIADFLTNPITSKFTKPELPSDKIREILEIMPEKEEKITSIDAIVDKRMDHLEDVKGTFYMKQQLLAVRNKWKNRKTPAMVEVVNQAFTRLGNKTKSNGGSINKVEPEPFTSSESRCGPPPNGNSQNQEPIGGTDNNV
jgi:chitin synthase